jgi:hypothetical protein
VVLYDRGFDQCFAPVQIASEPARVGPCPLTDSWPTSSPTANCPDPFMNVVVSTNT